MCAKKVGEKIGEFTILDVFNNGNFSNVYKVRNDANEVFALKAIQYGKIDTKEERDALIESARRETQIGIMSGINSPHLVKYHKIFNEGSIFCILMEFCGGGMLDDMILKRKEEDRFFSEDEVLDVTYQLTSGLHELRTKNVIHRDLKSENIFLGNDGNLKIGDYGVGKVIESQSSFTQTMVGTPYYMSPEILLGKAYSFQCDIWSLGVLIYYMMTYEYPFTANSYMELVNAITKGAHKPIQNPTYSKELKKLISEMLVVNPDNRITTLGILQDTIFHAYLRAAITPALLDMLEKKKITVAQLAHNVELVAYLKWYTLMYGEDDEPSADDAATLEKMVDEFAHNLSIKLVKNPFGKKK